MTINKIIHNIKKANINRKQDYQRIGGLWDYADYFISTHSELSPEDLTDSLFELLWDVIDTN